MAYTTFKLPIGYPKEGHANEVSTLFDVYTSRTTAKYT